MSGTPSFVNLLRIWIGFVGVIAFGSAVQCFINPNYIYERIYTSNNENVSTLTSRLFGVWTFLSGSLRVMCALDLYNKRLYHVTLLSFILALGHFISEVYIYRTAQLQSAGILAPLFVSSTSILLMLIGYTYVGEEDPRAKFGNENDILVPKKKKSQ
ncbi:ergosterol biosynthetic protein 28 [Plakobranchus ocellatus]|uniref:Ergosterol biosynthetic protein 28 n=1 Tax=Plakobranchus ocellatus TaxID=259542 RepID=A0AAV4DVY9_9GAST|nr:ergosterol biosynthetic protein 28 [Plakobranchus ocellatus]